MAIPPPPPITIYGVTYQSRSDTLTGDPENIFERNQRILVDVETRNGFEIQRMFNLFNKQLGVPANFDFMVAIFRDYKKEDVKKGISTLISTCEKDLAYKNKITSYFLKSLRRFIININQENTEQQQAEKVEVREGVLAKFFKKADGVYLEYLKFTYNDKFEIFCDLYHCVCNRVITMEQDYCQSCGAKISWQRVNNDLKKKVDQYKTDKHWELFYDKTFRTNNYGDWPSGM